MALLVGAAISALLVSGIAAARSTSSAATVSSEAGVVTTKLPSKCKGKSKGKIGFANAYQDGADPTWFAIRDVFIHEAGVRCYEVVYLNNNVDVPTAVKNADILISKKVKYAVEFQVIESGNAVIAAKFKKAKIPVIAWDVGGPGMHWMGLPNHTNGFISGTKLGKFAKKRWNCQIDMIMVFTANANGEVMRIRVQGGVDGILKQCPNARSSIVEKDAGTVTPAEVQAAARDMLASKPNAKRILIVGSDVEPSALDAAEQLGRAGEMWGYGSFWVFQGEGVHSHLLGSQVVFLEGYPVPTFKIIDKLDKGIKITNDVGPTSKGSTVVGICSMNPAQAKALPPANVRAKTLINSKPGTTMEQLYCPKGTLIKGTG